jgi:hypothetical protein
MAMAFGHVVQIGQRIVTALRGLLSSRYASRNENFVPVVLTSAFDSTMPSAYAAAILAPDF